MFEYILEFIGTFLFLYVILNYANLKIGELSIAAIPIAIALATGIFLCSGAFGHLNPAVSVMFRLKGSIDNNQLGYLVLAQILGAVAALMVFNYTKKKSLI